MIEKLPAILIILFITPLLALSQSKITNQRIYDTIPNQPDVYIEKTTIFNAEPIEYGRIMFLGNSITQGGKWKQLFNDNTIINRGISGDNTFGMLQRMKDVVNRKPSKIFVLIGINDISKDIPVSVIADNYRQIVEEIQQGSPDTKIYIQSLLPLNPDYQGFPQHFDKQDEVLKLNELLKNLAQRTNTEYLDIAPVFMDSNNQLHEEYTYDGLHLNEKGYEVWAKYLNEKGYIM